MIAIQRACDGSATDRPRPRPPVDPTDAARRSLEGPGACATHLRALRVRLQEARAAAIGARSYAEEIPGDLMLTGAVAASLADQVAELDALERELAQSVDYLERASP